MFTMRTCIILIYVFSVVAKPLEKHESSTTAITGGNHTVALPKNVTPGILTSRHRIRRQVDSIDGYPILKYLPECRSKTLQNNPNKNQCIEKVYTCAPLGIREMDCSLSSFGKHYCQPVYNKFPVTIGGVTKCVLQTVNCKTAPSHTFDDLLCT